MRASRYEIFMYASIAAVPALIFLIFLSTYAGASAVASALSYLLIIAMAVFFVTGAKEVFVHARYQEGARPILQGERRVYPHMGRPIRGAEVVSLNVRRFNSETNKFDEASYKVNATKHTTVLGALLDIKSYSDNTLSVRCNCRMGICGSCGVVVNGKQKLACETNLLESSENGSVTVSPMLGHPMLKDLADNFDDFFKRHISVSPTLERKDVKEKYAAKQEYKMSKEDTDKFLPYSYCIMCGLCLDACPVVNSNPNFVGPQALSQAYRYHADKRDQGGKRRLFDADTADGAWGCEFAGACSSACPKGVDPAAAIQMLKSDIMKNMLEEE